MGYLKGKKDFYTHMKWQVSFDITSFDQLKMYTVNCKAMTKNQSQTKQNCYA